MHELVHNLSSVDVPEEEDESNVRGDDDEEDLEELPLELVEEVKEWELKVVEEAQGTVDGEYEVGPTKELGAFLLLRTLRRSS